MGDIAALRLDEDLAKDGVWVHWQDGIELKIASTSQASYEQAERRALAPHRRRIDQGKMSMREQLVVLAPVVADLLLKDWRNLVEDGEPVEYSKEKSRGYLTDPALFDLLLFVFNTASENAEYRAAQRKESEGN